METLKYPIGRFIRPNEVSHEELLEAMDRISAFPVDIEQVVGNLDATQLDTPYRPNGWTVGQVIHHCADSHMNAYIRFKWAMTEETPVIKPYDQAAWANLPDSTMVVPWVSLPIIRGIHIRWVILMREMTEDDWNKKFIHPEHNTTQNLKQVLKMYAWHCDHHLAHITKLIEREGWG